MSERPEEGREERRRTGPLGDEDDETRRVPTENGPEATRQVREEAASAETRGVARAPSEENETRVIRVPSHPDTTRDATPYPRGYFEATEEREDRLRHMYGGVDWLASFLGLVFAIVLGAVFSAVAGLVLVPFGRTPGAFRRGAQRGHGAGLDVYRCPDPRSGGRALQRLRARRDGPGHRQPGRQDRVHGRQPGRCRRGHSAPRRLSGRAYGQQVPHRDRQGDLTGGES